MSYIQELLLPWDYEPPKNNMGLNVKGIHTIKRDVWSRHEQHIHTERERGGETGESQWGEITTKMIAAVV